MSESGNGEENLPVSGKMAGVEPSTWAPLACTDNEEGCLPELHMHFARFLLPLPSYVPVPDGMEVLRAYEKTTDDLDATTYTITAIRQVEVAASSAEHISANAAFKVLARLGISEGDESGEEVHFPHELDKMKISVADVITTVASLEAPLPGWDGVMQNLSTESDALMRCIHSARDIVRAVALTEQPRVVPPSHERLPAIVMLASATKPLMASVSLCRSKMTGSFRGRCS